jgi:hypothetical protein
MRQFISLKSLAFAAVIATGLAFNATANAGGCHTPRCYYKTVITWQIIEEPFYDYVTKYDHCGRAYQARILSYRTVKVPVEKLVKVCY